MIVTVNGAVIDQDGNWIYCQEKNVEINMLLMVRRKKGEGEEDGKKGS